VADDGAGAVVFFRAVDEAGAVLFRAAAVVLFFVVVDLRLVVDDDVAVVPVCPAAKNGNSSSPVIKAPHASIAERGFTTYRVTRCTRT
jgi:hypothetical protein